MSSKLFGLLSLSIFSLILTAGLASAASLNLVPVSVPSSINQGQTSISITFNVSNQGATNYTELNWSGSSSNIGSWTTLPTLTALNVSEEKTLSATLTIPSNAVGTINATIDLQSETTAEAQLNVMIPINIPTPQSIPDEIKECNATGNLGSNLRIKIDDITVKEGYGKDEEWLPLDEIEIDIKVENRGGDQDINNIAVGWGLYNKDTDEFYIDDEEKDFDLNKNDDKTITVTFRLDKNIDELADDNFVFYAWANAEDEEFNDDETCESTSKNIDMIIENDFVILDNIKSQETVQCGAELQITADVWNIGEDDQDDVSVYINNKELGIIDKKVEIGDINAFEDEKLDVTIQIPNNVQEKSYGIKLSVSDEDNDVYMNDDDKSINNVIVKVQGGCGEKESKALVSAVLQSGGNAGEKLIIKSTITNTGEEKTTYTLNIAGYTEWADSADLDKKIIILDQGDSDSVLVTFDVKDDASGDYNFDIEVLSDSNLVIKQPASVTIEKKSTTGISGITGRVIGGENWYLWAIGALNIILVIVIIIVAIRVARKK